MQVRFNVVTELTPVAQRGACLPQAGLRPWSGQQPDSPAAFSPRVKGLPLMPDEFSLDAKDSNMLTRFSIRVTAVAIASGLVLALLAAWRADRRDRAQLAADLAAGRQALAQADARQHDRDAQLLQTLAALAAEKRAVTAPAQILRKLPQQIPLPVPLTLQAPEIP
jgi:hypothetical protein